MRLINIEREANAGGTSVKITIEVFPPLSTETEDMSEQKEGALKETYGKTAEAMASYLCSSQNLLKENQPLGAELFRILSRNMTSAANEAMQL
ncbi:MAG: hypothetical protein E4H47_00775, partial [Parcubacteria group bacterium]